MHWTQREASLYLHPPPTCRLLGCLASPHNRPTLDRVCPDAPLRHLGTCWEGPLLRPNSGLAQNTSPVSQLRPSAYAKATSALGNYLNISTFDLITPRVGNVDECVLAMGKSQ